MKPTFKTTLTSIALIAALASGSAMACKNDNGEKGGMKGLERMASQLNLTAEQKTQLDEIIAKKKADRDSVHANTTEEQREEMKAVAKAGMQKAFQDQIKAILTPEQAAQYEAMMERKGERKGHGKGGNHSH